VFSVFSVILVIFSSFLVISGVFRQPRTYSCTNPTSPKGLRFWSHMSRKWWFLVFSALSVSFWDNLGILAMLGILVWWIRSYFRLALARIIRWQLVLVVSSYVSKVTVFTCFRVFWSYPDIWWCGLAWDWSSIRARIIRKDSF